MNLMCDIGGDYIDGPGGSYSYRPRCAKPATVRYRGPGFVEGHWNGRCDQHKGMLGGPGMVIEPVGASQ